MFVGMEVVQATVWDQELKDFHFILHIGRITTFAEHYTKDST